MKTLRMKKVAVIALVALMFTGTNLYAQRGRNGGQGKGMGYNQSGTCQMIPDLTEDQQTKINALRVSHLKVMNNYRNQMDELRARKHTLMASDNADMKAINAVIDQMSDLQNKMMKEGAKHQQDVRSLLTEEQKVYFDSRPMRGPGNGGGMRHDGYGRGAGQGIGAGYGRGLNPNCPYNDSNDE